MSDEDIQEEAKMLAQNMLGGRTEEFTEGAIRVLESIIAMAECAPNRCVSDEDLKLFYDFFMYYGS